MFVIMTILASCALIIILLCSLVAFWRRKKDSEEILIKFNFCKLFSFEYKHSDKKNVK